MREPISPAERLVLTLRFFASGDSQNWQGFSSNVHSKAYDKISKKLISGARLTIVS